MNNLAKTATAVLGIAFIASCNQPASKTTSNTATDSTNTTAISAEEKVDKIVYVNSDTLSEKYEYFKEVRSSLEAKVKKAQNDLQSKGQAFQREVADYQKSAATMSASDRQATEERLARKQDELGRLDQTASQSLAQDEQTEFSKVYTAITDYLKKHAEEHGYQFVLTYSKTNPAVLYADDKLDITNEVLNALNEEHNAKKSSKK